MFHPYSPPVALLELGWFRITDDTGLMVGFILINLALAVAAYIAVTTDLRP